MTAASVTPAAPKRRLRDRLPVVHQLRQSVGLQRGMLVAGLVMLALFIICAVFAPLLAPYGFAQRSDASGSFGSQQPPSPEHLFGTTVGSYDVLSRTIWGAQTAILVVIVAVTLSLFIGVALGSLRGVLRRVARQVDGRRVRRDLRLPVAAARDRAVDRHLGRPVEPLGRHPRGRRVDRRGVHPAVLPRDPRRDGPHQG